MKITRIAGRRCVVLDGECSCTRPADSSSTRYAEVLRQVVKTRWVRICLCNSSGTSIDFAGQIAQNRLTYGG